MAKFIIEVSDEYIRDHANVEKISERMKGEKDEFMMAMMDMVVFSAIEKKLDEGVNEFTVTADDMEEGTEKKLFDSAVSRAGAAILVTLKNEAEKQSEKSE